MPPGDNSPDDTTGPPRDPRAGADHKSRRNQMKRRRADDEDEELDTQKKLKGQGISNVERKLFMRLVPQCIDYIVDFCAQQWLHQRETRPYIELLFEQFTSGVIDCHPTVEAGLLQRCVRTYFQNNAMTSAHANRVLWVFDVMWKCLHFRIMDITVNDKPVLTAENVILEMCDGKRAKHVLSKGDIDKPAQTQPWHWSRGVPRTAVLKFDDGGYSYEVLLTSCERNSPQQKVFELKIGGQEIHRSQGPGHRGKLQSSKEDTWCVTVDVSLEPTEESEKLLAHPLSMFAKLRKGHYFSLCSIM